MKITYFLLRKKKKKKEKRIVRLAGVAYAFKSYYSQSIPH